jgi:hypothetical protein
MPTHRSYPDRQQDALRFRHLVDEAEQELRQRTTIAMSRALMARFRGLLNDDAFWTHRLDGLAVLGSPDTFEVFDLQQPVTERAVVAESFDVTPLVRITQSADQFHVLALQQESVALYQGNRHHLDRIEPEGVPLSGRDVLMTEAPPAPNQEEHITGNPPPGLAGALGNAKLELDRFYRTLDQALFSHLSRDSRSPLVLAGLPELQAAFRSVSRNPHLVANGIPRGAPMEVDAAFIHDAWKCVEPHYQKRLEQIVNDYHVAKARNRAASDLREVARAIASDRVGILMVEADRTIPGLFAHMTGQILLIDDRSQTGPDLLAAFVEAVLQTDGTAIVVPKDRMPTETGVAAIFRF